MMRVFVGFLVYLGIGWGQSARAIHPVVRDLVNEISEERIEATMRKLGAFQTRDTNSVTDDPARGIGAAREWIRKEFQSYSPRLEVAFDTYRVKATGRLVKDTDVMNVIAVLPGKSNASVKIAVGAHYDTLCFVNREGKPDNIATAEAPLAPGVDDNASGVAAVMELARVLSQREFDKTLIFVAFAGEEQGLFGATLLAQKMKSENQNLEALLNNDTIGSVDSGNGFRSTHAIRVFSAEPADSSSRSLARYIKDVGERYVPEMRVDLVFRTDRFGRGGDHTPFHREGFAAVRFTTPAENLTVQHTPQDTWEHTTASLTARVTRINAAVLANLANAPTIPKLQPVARGASRFDAILRWKPAEETDVAGYSVVVRSTLSAYWEREIDAGNVSEFTLKNFSIDDVVLGVKVRDRDGFESLAAAYQQVPFAARPVETVAPGPNEK